MANIPVPRGKATGLGTGKSPGSVKTQFKKGESGNPLGRPKGSKQILNENFLSAICQDFERHGADAIVAARELDPVGYIKVIAGLLPKQVDVGGGFTITWMKEVE